MPGGLIGGTRPEFEHHVLVIPLCGPLLYGPLGFHCRRSTKSFFCLARPLYFQHEILCTQTQVSLRTVSWNLPGRSGGRPSSEVPSIFRVARQKAGAGIIAGFSTVNGLCRNDA
jgi:hypothetical protein